MCAWPFGTYLRPLRDQTVDPAETVGMAVRGRGFSVHDKRRDEEPRREDNDHPHQENKQRPERSGEHQEKDKLFECHVRRSQGEAPLGRPRVCIYGL